MNRASDGRQAPQGTQSAAPMVLVVEDHEDVRELLWLQPTPQVRAVLEKPFDLYDLVAAVARCVHSPRPSGMSPAPVAV